MVTAPKINLSDMYTGHAKYTEPLKNPEDELLRRFKERFFDETVETRYDGISRENDPNTLNKRMKFDLNK